MTLVWDKTSKRIGKAVNSVVWIQWTVERDEIPKREVPASLVPSRHHEGVGLGPIQATSHETNCAPFSHNHKISWNHRGFPKFEGTFSPRRAVQHGGLHQQNDEQTLRQQRNANSHARFRCCWKDKYPTSPPTATFPPLSEKCSNSPLFSDIVQTEIESAVFPFLKTRVDVCF